mgnify:FL=1|jgi:hypothetical protein
MNIYLLRDYLDNEDKNVFYTHWKELKNSNPKMALEIGLGICEASKHRKVSETIFEAGIVAAIKSIYHVIIPRNTVRKYYHRRDEKTRNGNFKGSSKYWIGKLEEKV